ncbi:MAG: polysaccharide deacetylase family protein [Rhodoferax sp.]|nr:polysaccharide deacetylase family protein [Rhodoferax sp.]
MLGPLIRWSACRGGSPRLSVFIYHRVLPEPDPLFPGELDRQRFDMQLGWIRRWFNVMPLAAAVQRLRDGSLPPAAAAITFDDGYADNLHHAAPVLQRHGMTATLFVATGFLEGGCMWNDRVIAAVRLTRHDALDLPPLLQEPLPTRTTAERQATIGALIRKIKYLEPGERDRTVAEVVAAAGIQLPRDLMLTHDELRQWHAQGHGVGGHTVNHPILARLADDQARHEIATGRDELEALLDTRIALFAYPNGKPGVDYLPVHATMVRELGFDAAVSTAWGAATARSPRFEIPRFTPWDATPARFGMRLVRNLLTS